MLVCSVNGHRGWGIAKSKRGAQSSSWVSHVDVGAQALGLYSAAFLGILAQNWTGNEAAGS